MGIGAVVANQLILLTNQVMSRIRFVYLTGVVAFGFTVTVAVLVIGGTLWVLHSVGAHMMSR